MRAIKVLTSTTMLPGLVIAVSLTYSAPAYSVDLLVNNYLPPKTFYNSPLLKLF